MCVSGTGQCLSREVGGKKHVSVPTMIEVREENWVKDEEKVMKNERLGTGQGRGLKVYERWDFGRPGQDWSRK